MGSSRSDNTETDHIPIGYVRKAHGIRGDVVVRGLVDDAGERFVAEVALTTREQPSRTLQIVSRRTSGDDYLLHLSGIDTRNDAESLVGVQFVVDRSERRKLSPDEWWVEDLVGCAVVDRAGRYLGDVTEVISGAVQDRLVLTTTDNKRGEIPLVAQLVPEVDIAEHRITVDLPDGLIA